MRGVWKKGPGKDLFDVLDEVIHDSPSRHLLPRPCILATMTFSRWAAASLHSAGHLPNLTSMLKIVDTVRDGAAKALP